jgi:hypothetical protein
MFDDIPPGMMQQSFGPRPVSGAELEVYGKKASSMWSEGCFDTLSKAVVSVVKEANLNPEQVKRVVEFANTDAFLREFDKEGSANKYVDFGEGKLAEPSRVLHDLNDGGERVVIDVDTQNYDHPPEEKKASLSNDEFEAVFGKIAEKPVDHTSEYRREREKAAGYCDHLNTQLSGLETMYMDVSNILYGHVKQAAMEGIPLGDVIKSWMVITDDPVFVKCAFEAISPRLLKEEVFRTYDSVGASIEKTSSLRIVNAQHPLVDSFSSYCAVLEKLAETRGTLDQLTERVATMDYELEKLSVPVTGGLMGAARKVVGATGRAGEAIGGLIGGGGSGVQKVMKRVGQAAPVAAGVGAAGLAGLEAKHQLETSPTAGMAASYLVPGSSAMRMRKAIERQQAMQEAQSSPWQRQGLMYMQ